MSSRERAAMRTTFRPVASILAARWSTATLLGADTRTYMRSFVSDLQDRLPSSSWQVSSCMPA